MAHTTPPDLLVLHALRCVGSAPAARLAKAAGLDEGDTVSELIDHARSGYASFASGTFGGWSLTQAGRTRDAELIAAELVAADARPAVEWAYAQFLPLNPELLDLSTDWQLMRVGPATWPNDHTDAGYDALVLRRLTILDRRAQVILARLETVLRRFGTYRTRLSGALAAANTGEHAMVADDVDSYHAVWFQWHEDLLVTLGRPRFQA